MLGAIGQGILFGIALCFSIGPAFFGLIQTSLRHGHAAGIEMALGIFASDLTYLLLAYFGLSGWMMDEKYALPVGLTGGALLIGYGSYQIFKKTIVQSVEGDVEIKSPTLGTMMLKGFLMNLLNPFILILWLSAMTLASNRFNNDYWPMFAFFVATLATVLGTDILKALGAGKIKSYLNENMLHKVNIIAGIILVISGLVLIVRVFVEEPWAKK
ncbi:MAG: LysE family translocator [Bacteroidetes bacterium]|nr:LysE family translocator [Bacteroidota bacterium]